MIFSVQTYSEKKLNLRKGEREREGEREGERERNNYILLQYAVLELPIDMNSNELFMQCQHVLRG